AGFTLDVNVHEVEKNSTPVYAGKYLLGLENPEETTFADQFRLEVKSITRREPAELDEAFYQKFDPSGEVTDEAALRERIIKDNAAGFNKQGESMVDYQVQKTLVENTEIELPEEFLKRAHEEGQQTYERFVRGIRWMLIRSKYSNDNDLEVKEEDLRAAATEQLLAMMGGQRPDWLNDEFINNYTARMLEDEKQRNELLYSAQEKKIMADLRGKIKTKEILIASEDFNEKIEVFNKELQDSDEEE
ncbi:MAG: hypothetical protein AAFQ37_08015, partial [Bacteroidota bacterium]